MATEISLLEQLHERYLHYPYFIQIAVVGIHLFIIFIVLIQLVLLFKRLFNSSFEQRKNNYLEQIIQELVGNLMIQDVVAEQDVQAIVGRLKYMAKKDPLYNQLLIDTLVYYHRNMTGTTATLLSAIYQRMDLEKSSVAKLQNNPWYIQVNGLQELQEMTPSFKSLNYIHGFLDSENNDLRIVAQAAHINLNQEHPFSFLEKAQQPLLDWHQVLLFDLICNNDKLQVPDFSANLKSRNQSVIIFSIKLIEYYQQLHAIPTLMEIMDHPEPKIKEAVIGALGKLDAEDGEQKMIAIYSQQCLSVKLKILKAVGDIASGKSLTFLYVQFLKANNYHLMKTAGRALARYPAFDREAFLNRSDDILPFRKKIILHYSNTLIRN
ncbi:hypothetical protein IWX76_002984 [Pedobacter sp. CAN_A7]|uniref:HEAT repeat domain-containing protein n=1 Tax=Pedobacter sp. CAN_A7 TaxID=2787722 RepID=UPI0018C91B01